MIKSFGECLTSKSKKLRELKLHSEGSLSETKSFETYYDAGFSLNPDPILKKFGRGPQTDSHPAESQHFLEHK